MILELTRKDGGKSFVECIYIETTDDKLVYTTMDKRESVLTLYRNGTLYVKVENKDELIVGGIKNARILGTDTGFGCELKE